MYVGIKYKCRKKYVSGALFMAIYDLSFAWDRIHGKGHNFAAVWNCIRKISHRDNKLRFERRMILR